MIFAMIYNDLQILSRNVEFLHTENSTMEQFVIDINISIYKFDTLMLYFVSNHSTTKKTKKNIEINWNEHKNTGVEILMRHTHTYINIQINNNNNNINWGKKWNSDINKILKINQNEKYKKKNKKTLIWH